MSNKLIANQSPKVSLHFAKMASKIGVSAIIIEKSRGHYRRLGPNGSTSVPQKVIMLDGIRFGIGGARQYLAGKKRGF